MSTTAPFRAIWRSFYALNLAGPLGQRAIRALTCVLVYGVSLAPSQVTPQSSTSVVTYHNDPQRTGWNATEQTLTPANVKAGTFGFYTSVALDDRIDTQPLVVKGVAAVNSSQEVVYVATEGNTVYAIDPGNPNTFPAAPKQAKILTKRSLGSPVPLPLNCTDSGGNVGINGTPTIDLASRTMYVIAYTSQSGKPTYQLHALDLGTLNDKPGSPVTITASHTLAGGSKISFDASVQRQRPGLLLADGNVYAGFGSFCDFTSTSRGWLLGWNAATLAPLAANELTDTETTAGNAGCPQNCFLSSIWMSGYGIAAETPGDVFFVTGNSGGVYNGTTDLQESVVKVAPNLAAVHHVFTPTDVAQLDKDDTDFGSGGVMVVPDQPGPMPLLAVAAGKAGQLFILNRSNLGGLSNQPKVDIGACWCGPSYFKGSDGVGRVVSSGGLQAKTWKINTAATPPLQLEASASALAAGGQDGGFFTSISSNGTAANTAIIWALGRPTGPGNQVTLYAFNGTQSAGTLQQLWSGVAGARPTSGGNANLVPTVANGKVYVASYQILKIGGETGRPLVEVPDVFESSPTAATKLIQDAGLVAKFAPAKGTWVGSQSPVAGTLAFQGTTVTMTLRSGVEPLAAAARISTNRAAGEQAPPADNFKIKGALYWGTIKSVADQHLSIELRTGKLLSADLSQATKSGTTVNPVVGLYVVVNGSLDPSGVMQVRSMSRAKAPVSWGQDQAK
jgi:hypothetical protein